jgi:hypothetical protein
VTLRVATSGRFRRRTADPVLGDAIGVDCC